MSAVKYSPGPLTPHDKPESQTPPAAGPNRVNKVVFFGSATGVLAVALWAIIFTEKAEAVIGAAVTWVGSTFGWWYSLPVVAALIFVIGVALSNVGKTRLGPDHSRPTFNLFTWTAMLFAAGIGIDPMFFSVSEPVA